MSLSGQYVVLLLSGNLNHIDDLYKIKSEIARVKVEILQVWFKEVPFIIKRLLQVNGKRIRETYPTAKECGYVEKISSHQT